MASLTFLDCTLRDGGYYNSWDFDHSIVQDYLFAVSEAGVNVVEIGFRTLNKNGFKGACYYSTDSFISSFQIPNQLGICVMINASEIISDGNYVEENLKQLFPLKSHDTSIEMVRIASHTYEFLEALKAVKFLKSNGYKVGFNLMQVSESSNKELIFLSKAASKFPIDVLYFADSLGNMDSNSVENVIKLFRNHWKGDLGIHAHDNMGLGLSNSLQAIKNGVAWIDSTVTGMGRGAGNVKSELLAIEMSKLQSKKINIKPMMSLIKNGFKPMKDKYGWGINPFYYLSGMKGVHPTYVQEMISDSRYSEGDIIAVINHLSNEGGKKYSSNSLNQAQNFYSKEPNGTWSPESIFKGKQILLIGSGPSVFNHKKAIELYIKSSKPLVLALNTSSMIDNDLIDMRIACHPVRLMTDCEKLNRLSKPLISPISLLSDYILESLSDIELMDFGIGIEKSTHKYGKVNCVLPTPLVIAYALAVTSSGKAETVFLAGFDGYSADDPRRIENDLVFEQHQANESGVPIVSVTPTLYHIPSTSIYAL
jgi:4-hydroxy 2-oxovalerate aldolase